MPALGLIPNSVIRLHGILSFVKKKVLRKIAAVLAQSVGLSFTFLWAGAFLLIGYKQAAVINLLITALFIGNLLIFFLTKNLIVNVNSALFLMMLWVFTLQTSLGGFFRSGLVGIWMVLCPLIATRVIGRNKFIYDLWGDTVNTASRMESNGLANIIQVTESTYQKLCHLYRFEEREPIFVKGKGQMVTYLLIGPV